MKNPDPHLWSHIKAIHFVDAGLAEPKMLYDFCHDFRELKALVSVLRNDFVVHLHATPRQLADQQRPWMMDEFMAFQRVLRMVGINFEVHRYPGGMDLDTHFDSIACGLCQEPPGFFSKWSKVQNIKIYL